MVYKNNYSVRTKFLGVLRFFFLRLIFLKKLETGSLGLVGKGIYFHIIKGAKMTIGNRPIFADYSEIQVLGKLIIGNNLTMNRFSRIISHKEIRIGNNVTIAQFVTILDHDHKYECFNNILSLNGYITSPISIGDNVWIGDKVTILKGVKIGNNVIIAANSLVNKNVPDNCIAGGVPAKFLKQLY